MKLKKVLAAAMAVTMLGSLTACGGSGGSGEAAAAKAPAGKEASADGSKTVNLAMTTTMGDLDPFAPPTQGRNFLRYAVYDNIAIFKDFGTSWDQMQWVLAKNIEQKDDVTFEIELYDYIHDALGNPIHASDVVFCLNSISESGNFTRFTNYMESASVIDDNHLEVKLKTTTVGAFEYMLAQCCIVSQKTYEEHKDQFSTKPITSGAYQVTECVSGSYYVLEKNPDYWQTDKGLRSYAANAYDQGVDKLVYNIVTEASQATIALQMGENDIVTVCNNAEIGYFMNQDGTPAEGYSVNKVLSSAPMILAFNMDEGQMFDGNLALRQAICYAINQEDIIAGGLRGNGEAIKDLGDKLCGDYNPEWNEEDYYDFDLDKAKAMLEEAGYPGGIDPATGAPLHIRLLIDQQYKDTAVVIQSQLIAAGLDAEINAYDNSLLATYQYDPAQWDLYVFIQGTECYVTSIYDGIFDAGADGKAPKCFVKDETLQGLVEAAHEISTHGGETVEALHDYVRDNAYAYGLYQSYTFSVGRDTIGLVNHPWGQLVGPACDYTNFK